ncbi:MAG: hypothetical protein INQ03_07635 [Candidatus Heimdallarchaeota archaeon]|nr:hypothetical protein [Candidatus Heimdallarchaeota archaeon]
MSTFKRDPSAVNAGLTFLSFAIIGIIVAVYIVKDEKYRAPIIIGFFLLGAVITGMELAALVKKSNQMPSLSKEDKKKLKEKRADKDRLERERELRMARYVAEVFNENIPEEEFEEKED